MSESLSEIFHEIDSAFMKELGSKTVDQIVVDLRANVLSIRDVARKNKVASSSVIQVARFYKFDPVTLESTN